MRVLPLLGLVFISSATPLPEQCSSLNIASYPGINLDAEHLSLIQKRAKAHLDLGIHPHFRSLSSPSPIIKIKAYYLKSEPSQSELSCMELQLLRAQAKFRQMGMYLEYQAWPAVTFNKCTNVRECFQEHPECFPAGTWTSMVHPQLASQYETVEYMKDVIGNWCSHLKIVKQFQYEPRFWDYHLLLKEDVILTEDFVSSVFSLLDTVPPLWTLASFDTFNDALNASYVFEDMLINSGLPLFSISGIKSEYRGAQAWMISGERAHSFAEWYLRLPAMKSDWVPRAPKPMHMGFLAYGPGTALQPRFASENSTNNSCQNSDMLATSGEDKTLEMDMALMNTSDNTNRTPREVIIFGMYNTGTNLMTDLIRKNLEKPNGVELCRNFSAGAYCGGVWKHTHPNRIEYLSTFLHDSRREINLGGFREAVAVVMVRHPFSLLRSMQVADYDMDCGNLSQPGWLKAPCYYRPTDKLLEAQLGMPRLNKPTCYDLAAPCWDNLVSAWNSYTYGYLHLIQELFHKVIFLRYEDVVTNPHPALEQIAFLANVSMPREVMQVLNPSKMVNGFASNDHEEALQKVNAVGYLSDYSDEEHRDICSQLNLPLLYTLGYHACRPVDNTIRDSMESQGPFYPSIGQEQGRNHQQQQQQRWRHLQ